MMYRCGVGKHIHITSTVQYAWYKVTFAATVRSLSILDIPTSLSTVQKRQCVRFVLLRFRIAINSAFMVILCRWQQRKQYLGIHVKCPIFFFLNLPKFGFYRHFHKPPILKFTKILPVGAELTHADRQDITKPIGAFRSSMRTRVKFFKIGYSWVSRSI